MCLKLINIRLIAWLILILGSYDSFGQDDDFGVVFWSKDRNLEWDDIQGTVIGDSAEFYLDVYADHLNDGARYYYDTNSHDNLAYVYKKSSYVSDKLRSDGLLRYYNVLFDMAAYYSFKYIKMTKEARESQNPTIRNNIHIVGNAVIEEWKLEANRLAIETNYGENEENVLDWEERTNTLVLTIRKPKLKNVTPFAGFDLGIGGLQGTKGYDELLTRSVVGLFSAEVVVKPFLFAFGLSGGSQKVKKTFSKGNESFLIDSDPNLMNLFLHSGYSLSITKRFRVIPRAGIHYSNLRYPEDDEFDSSVWSISYTAGATLDVNLYNWNSSGYFDTVYSGISLRFGTYYYPMSLGINDVSHTLYTIGLTYNIAHGEISY